MAPRRTSSKSSSRSSIPSPLQDALKEIDELKEKLFRSENENDELKSMIDDLETKLHCERDSFKKERSSLLKKIDHINQISRLNVLYSDHNQNNSHMQTNPHSTQTNPVLNPNHDQNILYAQTNNIRNTQVNPNHNQNDSFTQNNNNTHNAEIISGIDREAQQNTANSGNRSLLNSSLGFNLKPDFYDGMTPSKEYLNQFEIISKVNNWDNAVKTTTLASYLRGKARAVLNNFTSANLDFSKLKKKLEMHFGDGHLSTTNYTLFQNRKQRLGEDVPSFASDLEQMASSVHADCSFEVQDRIACSQFVLGISDFYVKRTLQLEKASSLKQALTKAMEVKAINGQNEGFRDFNTGRGFSQETFIQFNQRNYNQQDSTAPLNTNQTQSNIHSQQNIT